MAFDTDAVDGRAAAWLELIDRSDANTSWQQAGAVFRAALTADAWGERLQGARGRLGSLTSRALAVEQRLDGIPGEPPGEYVVRQYHSIFGQTRAVVETLSLRREDDGVWRVVGYFIR